MTRTFEAVIFDMDGTIVASAIDFAAVRAELGVPEGQGILETIDAMDGDRRDLAHRRLLEIELAAVRNAPLVPHAAETLQAVQRAGMKTALLTRNARPAMETVLKKYSLRFDLAWSRENGPIKPEPIGVQRACRALGVRPEATACVGDFHYDVVAANAAGCLSVLLAQDGRPEYADEADCVITTLTDLPQLLGIR